MVNTKRRDCSPFGTTINIPSYSENAIEGNQKISRAVDLPKMPSFQMVFVNRTRKSLS